MNLASIIDAHPDDKVAIISRGQPITYAELRDQVSRLRGGLVGEGVQPGDRVAIVCANNHFFVVSYLAVLGVGAVAVPMNPLSPTPEIERELCVVRPRVAIVGPAGRRSFADLDRGAVEGLECVVGCGSGFDDALLFEHLVTAVPVAMVDRDPDDLAALIFTSGTAGLPKAAMLTHHNLEVNHRQMQQASDRQPQPDDVVLAVVPLFHVFGLNSVLGMALRNGSTLVLAERFDPAAALETIEQRKVTSMAGPPVMWSALASLPDASPEAFVSLRLPVSGAAKLSRFVIDLVRDRLGLELTQGYGLTEASPAVTVAGGQGAPTTSIGRPVPGLEVRLVDRDGSDVLIGDDGELWVRGPNVFLGYWEEPEATAAALDDDGWLHTGDIAVVDDDGFLFLVDRAKDLIIVSGFNVYPAEVESVLVRHPAVADAAVIGTPNPHTGEAVRAFVVLSGGTNADEDDIIQFCASQVAGYKCPVKVSFVDRIPRNDAGKILYRELSP
ncbi:MAG: AMP-binding protein [Acidimicrobiia bacterium]|nr:AMP-binding protein [Acidimicrobiia bacterium]